jgi:hypothetical protein
MAVRVARRGPFLGQRSFQSRCTVRADVVHDRLLVIVITP